MADTPITSLYPITQKELLPYLSGSDVLNLCQTNQAFRTICADDKIWYSLTRRDYQQEIPFHPNELTWRQYYLLLLVSRPVRVYYKEEIIVVPSFLLSLDYLDQKFPNWTAFFGFEEKTLRWYFPRYDPTSFSSLDLTKVDSIILTSEYIRQSMASLPIGNNIILHLEENGVKVNLPGINDWSEMQIKIKIRGEFSRAVYDLGLS